MESNCQIRTGMFVLKSCSNPAQYTCQSCQRSVCQEHVKNEWPDTLCRECFAKNQKVSKVKRDDNESDFDDDEDLDYYLSDVWYFSVRDQYYHRYEDYAAFDADDYNVFDKSTTSDFLDDSDTGSLFDS